MTDIVDRSTYRQKLVLLKPACAHSGRTTVILFYTEIRLNVELSFNYLAKHNFNTEDGIMPRNENNTIFSFSV
jgi:hypothetical protein